ncbi:MAG: sigma-70 family RNA polymerase sigma factor [Planctomycetes bacterium]|nr:sigma-70 family RNA polymerase sigma factor [Planctomycetota bacterium]
MPPPADFQSPSDVTLLLAAFNDGEAVQEQLFSAVYEELRSLAHTLFRREGKATVLQATALVHEAYLRLLQTNIAWESRQHFLAVAASAMRRILVDDARSRKAQKRGAGINSVSLHLNIASPMPDGRLIDLDEALTRFSSRHARSAQVVELRHFVGLPFVEVAEILGISKETAKRDWAFAKAWLYKELEVEALKTQ